MQSTTDSIEMEPDIAKHLFKTGAVLIMTGVPIGTEFGIDLSSYAVGERFRGVKMIPPGPHYVFCASQDSYGGTAPRVGFIHYFKATEIVVREWDPRNEEMRLRQCEDSDLEKRRIRDNLEDLDRFLAPYDFGNLSRWRRLTDTIKEETVTRCAPQCGFVRTSVEYLSCPDADRPRGGSPSSVKPSHSIVDESELLPDLKAIPGTALNFSEVSQRVPKGANPSDVTRHRMDCVEAVETYLAKFTKATDAIEEIQLAFVLFCSGYSVDGLSYWRRVLNILSNSEAAVGIHRVFYMKYLEVMEHQLPELPDELMEPTPKNTVFKDARSLLVNCFVAGLKVSVERLRDSLARSMKWTFHDLLDEDPEDMPVIVENVD